MNSIRGISVRVGVFLLALIVVVCAWSLWPDAASEPAGPLVTADGDGATVGFGAERPEADVDAAAPSALGEVSAEKETADPVRGPPARLDDAALWSELHAALQSMTDGTMSPEDVASLCTALLARVDESRATLSEDGLMKVYELIDVEGVGSATLTTHLDGSAPEVDNAFMLRASLATAPGFYTGFPDDGVTTSQLHIAVELGDDGGLAHCTTLGLTDFREGPHHFDEMLGRPPLPLGGWLSVRADGASYRSMTIEALRDEDGEMVWRNATGDPVARGDGREARRFDGVVTSLMATKR